MGVTLPQVGDVVEVLPHHDVDAPHNGSKIEAEKLTRLIKLGVLDLGQSGPMDPHKDPTGSILDLTRERIIHYDAKESDTIVSLCPCVPWTDGQEGIQRGGGFLK